MRNSKTEQEMGACHGDANPDAWFPDLPRGYLSERIANKILRETNRAFAICETCPIKAKCLQMGMEHENLGFGIWGGMLAGERVMLTGKTYKKTSEQGKALETFKVLGPLVRG